MTTFFLYMVESALPSSHAFWVQFSVQRRQSWWLCPESWIFRERGPKFSTTIRWFICCLVHWLVVRWMYWYIDFYELSYLAIEVFLAIYCSVIFTARFFEIYAYPQTSCEFGGAHKTDEPLASLRDHHSAQKCQTHRNIIYHRNNYQRTSLRARAFST